MNKEWWSLPPGVQNLSCIPFEKMEPYLLWYVSNSSVFYDERFYDYGSNKVSHLLLLRIHGYRFFVLTGMFGFDMPHTQYYQFNKLTCRSDRDKYFRKYMRNTTQFKLFININATADFSNIKQPICNKTLSEIEYEL